MPRSSSPFVEIIADDPRNASSLSVYVAPSTRVVRVHSTEEYDYVLMERELNTRVKSVMARRKDLKKQSKEIERELNCYLGNRNGVTPPRQLAAVAAGADRGGGRGPDEDHEVSQLLLSNNRHTEEHDVGGTSSGPARGAVRTSTRPVAAAVMGVSFAATCPPDDAYVDNEAMEDDVFALDAAALSEQIFIDHQDSDDSRVSASFRDNSAAEALHEELANEADGASPATQQRPTMHVLPTEEEVKQELVRMTDAERAELEAQIEAAIPHTDSNAEVSQAHEDLFVCPITFEPIRTPATFFGRVYEFDAITKWVQEHRNCPMTRQPATEQDIHKDYFSKEMKEILVKTFEERQQARREALRASLIEKRIASARLKQILDEEDQEKQDRAKRMIDVLRDQERRANHLQQCVESQQRTMARFQERSRQSADERNTEIRTLLEKLRRVDRGIRECEKEFVGLEGALIRLRIRWLAQQSVAEFNQAGIARTHCVGCGKFFTWAFVNPHTCARCKRVYCHACCNNVGAILTGHDAERPNRRSNNDQEGGEEEGREGGVQDSDDEVSPPEHGETLAPHILRRFYRWHRICAPCYTQCLHARRGLTVDLTTAADERSTSPTAVPTITQPNFLQDSVATQLALTRGATSRVLTDPAMQRAGQLTAASVSIFNDTLPTFYVLTPEERNLWWRLIAREDLPEGVVAEWMLAPHRATESIHSASVFVRDEVWPVVVHGWQWFVEKSKEKLFQ